MYLVSLAMPPFANSGIDGQITDRVPFYPPKDLEKLLKLLPYLEGLAVHFPRQSLHPIRDPNPLSYLVPDRPGSDMIFDQKTLLVSNPFISSQL